MALPKRDGGHQGMDGKVADLRVLRPRRAPPAEAARVTRAEINLAHVRHNLRELSATMAADAGSEPASQIWAVLKADGYGHGAAAVARTLEQAGVAGLCVALLEEGIELRNAGVACPILVMGGYYGRYRDGVEALIENDLTPVVYAADQLERIASTLRFVRGDHARQIVHLKLDTGMGRLGVREAELPALLSALRANPALRLDGLMTHLACADATDLAVTHKQLSDFDRLSAQVRQAGFNPRVRHAANSAAMLRLPGAQLSLVRPGIAVFGVHPCPDQPSSSKRTPKLKPVMRVLSEVVALRDLAVGDALGYGHTWRAKRPSRIATIPIGYADGFDRALSNRGSVLVCGRRAPIVGNVSMDLTMVDVTDLPGVGVRDEVVVLGPQKGRLGEDAISAHELAEKTDTIAWVCLTAISRRVPRFYRNP